MTTLVIVLAVLAGWVILACLVAPIVGRGIGQSGELYRDPDVAADIDACQSRHPSARRSA